MADLSAASEKCYIVFHMFCPQFPNLHVWKHIFMFSIQNTKFSFKITCDAHSTVQLALQSENVLAPLASIAYS